MHLGLDFDNTIVSYDALFHKLALEGGWITAEIPVSKVSVRDHLRESGREAIWTEMQGHVYGARMREATAYPGLINCLVWARGQGISLSIVSHKTKHPFIGEQYDLHEAARSWIDIYLTDSIGRFVLPEQVYFEATKDSKVKRIADIGCSVYVDDLPEILLHPAFPTNVKKILFDPDHHHQEQVQSLKRLTHWNEVKSCLELQCQSNH